MNINDVLNRAKNDIQLNDLEVCVLMLHAIDLLKHFNGLTQQNIDELKNFYADRMRMPLAA